LAGLRSESEVLLFEPLRLGLRFRLLYRRRGM